MFRHSRSTLDSISLLTRPDWAPFELCNQYSNNLLRFLKDVNPGNFGARILNVSDSNGYPAKSPDDRIMWYRRVVPERGHPSTKTGLVLFEFASLKTEPISADVGEFWTTSSRPEPELVLLPRTSRFKEGNAAILTPVLGRFGKSVVPKPSRVGAPSKPSTFGQIPH